MTNKMEDRDYLEILWEGLCYGIYGGHSPQDWANRWEEDLKHLVELLSDLPRRIHENQEFFSLREKDLKQAILSVQSQTTIPQPTAADSTTKDKQDPGSTARFQTLVQCTFVGILWDIYAEYGQRDVSTLNETASIEGDKDDSGRLRILVQAMQLAKNAQQMVDGWEPLMGFLDTEMSAYIPEEMHYLGAFEQILKEYIYFNPPDKIDFDVWKEDLNLVISTLRHLRLEISGEKPRAGNHTPTAIRLTACFVEALHTFYDQYRYLGYDYLGRVLETEPKVPGYSMRNESFKLLLDGMKEAEKGAKSENGFTSFLDKVMEEVEGIPVFSLSEDEKLAEDQMLETPEEVEQAWENYKEAIERELKEENLSMEGLWLEEDDDGD
ncbi:hypothetical protein DM02DRAFT_635007 [Periconia macrospinosa]|uniref:Uncharacterized protein n=1 Tax=Periconia macrospinosa TaxID=97972 RepID=A0A2V1D4B0_9PLEO|nr:hypothetical protein DM02DRAFT_635007 [Periconia macrospinosa]